MRNASEIAPWQALLLGLLASIAVPGRAAGVPPPAAAGADGRFEAEPAWRDEFDYEGAPDPARWDYDLGGHGWGNDELQHYTRDAENARVGGGVLRIVARRGTREGRDYTSARLVSRGRGDFLYGRFEIRARVPAARGSWAALWMLPTGGAYGPWPHSGEIDIMEHVGYDPDRIHVTVHTGAYNHVAGTQRGSATRVDGATTGFHVYRVDWTPEAIRGYVDDRPVFEYANDGSGPAAWPFDRPFHLLLNVAVGGSWGGREGVDPSAFPAVMEVDYVRVYPLATPGRR